jgi:hypothetical protein
VTTDAQKAMLEKMENDQKEREEKMKIEMDGVNVEMKDDLLDDTEKIEAETDSDLDLEVEIEEGKEVDGSDKKNEDKKNKNLTFVSSLTFANLIMEFTKTDKTEKNAVQSEVEIGESNVPPPFSPLYNSPSSPSPSSTSLDAKGSAYGVELALLRREGVCVY